MKYMLIALLALACTSVESREVYRSKKAIKEFKMTHPCPANGRGWGPCPGYVIDHIAPLACGGPDDPSNMMWQTVSDGKSKDKWERKDCSVWAKARPVAPAAEGKDTVISLPVTAGAIESTDLVTSKTLPK